MNADPKIVPSAGQPSSPDFAANEVAPTGDVHGQRTSALQTWLLRIRALLLVTLCAVFGVLLVILPWTPQWTDNPFLLTFPQLRDLVGSGYVRGVVSGLGLIDLWLGFWEAIHYHES